MSCSISTYHCDGQLSIIFWQLSVLKLHKMYDVWYDINKYKIAISGELLWFKRNTTL